MPKRGCRNKYFGKHGPASECCHTWTGSGGAREGCGLTREGVTWVLDSRLHQSTRASLLARSVAFKILAAGDHFQRPAHKAETARQPSQYRLFKSAHCLTEPMFPPRPGRVSLTGNRRTEKKRRPVASLHGAVAGSDLDCCRTKRRRVCPA